jgi:5-methylthioadenosine/S-adenosylhomocysteine deaminase
MDKSLQRSLLLRGNIVHPDGEARDRYVLVRDGRIVSVGRRRPPLTADVLYVETERNDWIFPGLINLHSHTDYNLLPLWHTPLAPFNNRFEWRGDAGYAADVKDLHKNFLGKGNEKGVAVFAELQAVAGGTSVLQENCPLDREVDGHGELLLCRDTSVAEDIGLDENLSILSVVDWFRPDPKTGLPVPQNQALASYVDLRQKGTLAATIVHLAEGRCGFGTNLGVDPYSRREFEAFMAHPAFQDAGAVRSSPLTLVHCSGIDVGNPAHIGFLRDRGISVVWSPVSNLLLYGDTLDVETLLSEGINVALGSDWAPSGSKHVWEEAKFARFYFDALNSTVSDEQIFQMVTTSPARCLGVAHLGRIEPGGLGDFFILRSPLESDSALEIFLSTSDRHVRATIIGGAPIYGERSLLEQFGVTLQGMPKVEGSAVAEKAVHLPERFEIDVDRDIGRIEAALKSLPTPVKRSNLLVASDKPYRRRIQGLRADAERFGWATQVWRHDGPLAHPGMAPVPPDSVRVWAGFRADGTSSADFRDKIGRTLIPATVQTQAPLGMTAYLPTVLPDAKPPSVPDEIALMFYESQAVYSGAAATTFGRVYALLQGSLFSPASKSGFPKPLDGELERDQPYFLFPDAVDWYGGRCLCMVGTPRPGVEPQEFRRSVRQLLGTLQQARPDGLDGAIVMVADAYMLCWEHWSGDAGKGAIDALAGLVEPVLAGEARAGKVAAGGFEAYSGLAIDPPGAALNLKFVRRALRPG